MAREATGTVDATTHTLERIARGYGAGYLNLCWNGDICTPESATIMYQLTVPACAARCAVRHIQRCVPHTWVAMLDYRHTRHTEIRIGTVQPWQ